MRAYDKMPFSVRSVVAKGQFDLRIPTAAEWLAEAIEQEGATITLRPSGRSSVDQGIGVVDCTIAGHSVLRILRSAD